MYAEFFGFRELPFNNTPDPRFFFATPDHEEGLASLIYAVKERKGFVLLTGEVGTGKTLVTRMMLRHFGTQLSFANISHGIQTPTELMESICTEFELEFEPDAGITQLIRLLHDFLLGQFAQDTPVVLVLDEAQNLPIQAFEQLRMIGNLEADDAKLLQIAIVGQPELQRRFLSPKLRQLRQRIFRSYHLPELTREMTDRYIRHRLSIVTDSQDDVFSADAVSSIYRVSQGLPRIINTICDNALLSAYSVGKKTIDGPFVESVVSQMMILGGDTPERDRAPIATRPKKVERPFQHASVPPPAKRQTIVVSAPAQRKPRANMRVHQEDATNAQAARIFRDKPSDLNVTNDTQSRLLVDNDAQSRQLMNELVHEREAIQSLHGSLAEMVQTVADATARADTVSSAMGQRDTQLRRASETISELVRNLRLLLDRARETTGDVVTVERGARKTCDRLSAQVSIAGRLIDELARLSSQGPSGQTHPSTTALRQQAASLADAYRQRNPGLADKKTEAKAQPTPIAELLRNARASLTDLRSLAVTGHPTGYVPPQDVGQKAASTKRLANQVEDILSMIDPSASARPKRLAAVKI